MLTKVEAWTMGGAEGLELIEKVDLPLESDIINTSPFQIRDTEGLGPAKTSISSTPFGTLRGHMFLGSSVNPRNIVLKIGLNPNWVDQSMSSLRNLLYNYFMTDKPVTLKFFSTHLPTVQIFGYVESFEPNIFSRDPEIQISIICPQPDFVESAVTNVNGLTNVDIIDVNYVGTISTGFRMVIAPITTTPGTPFAFSIGKTFAGLLESFQFSGIVDSTHNIVFSSEAGKKSIKNVAGPVETSLLSTVSDYSIWLVLNRGINSIQVSEVGVDTTQWHMEYFSRYGGI